MALFLAFAAVFLLIGLAYVIVTLAIIPGVAEERLGRLEKLPESIGEWEDDASSPEAQAAREEGLRRQSRLWIDADRDWLGRKRVLRQVRYIDASDRVIRTELDRRVRRRRVRS